MANTIEAQGVTVDEAIQLALNQLGVGRDSVEIKILHHPRGGFLGIGARRAKVRATVREDALQDGAEFDMSEGRRNRRRRRAPRHRRGGAKDGPQSEESGRSREQRGNDNRRDAGRGSGRDDSQRDTTGGGAADAEKDGEQRSGGGRRGNRRGGRGRQNRGGRGNQASQGGGDRDSKQGEQGAAAEGQEKSPGQTQGRERSGDRRRSGGRGRGRDRNRAEKTADSEAPASSAETAPPAAAAAPPQPAPSERPAPPPVEATATEPEVAAEPLPLTEIRERAEEIVGEMLRLMGFEAKVAAVCDEKEDEVVVQVQADAEGLLIGRRGQTLDAFEHLVNRSVAAREMAENRVIIDVGGYRDRRRESLLELAGRLKERAMSEGRRVQVSPMSPRDRKVFQDAFGEDADVTTRALGTGFYRRVLIIPEGADERGPAADAQVADVAQAESAEPVEPVESGDQPE